MREEKRYHPLAIVREGHNLTQKRLAEVVRIGERTVTRAENNKPISAESRRRLCEYFGMTAEQLGLRGESGNSTKPQITKKEEEVQTTSRENIPEQHFSSLPKQSSEIQEVPSLLPRAQVSDGLLSQIRSQSIMATASKPGAIDLDTIQSRRQVLQHVLSTACTTLILSPYALLRPDKAERLAMAVNTPSRLDTTALSDLDVITKSYWKLRKNMSFDLFSGVTGHFQSVIHLLKQPRPAALYGGLCSCASEIAQMLGQMLFDMQEDALAWSYYTFSLSAAQEARNNDLWAVGRGRMGLLCIHSDQPQNALSLLQEMHQMTIQNHTIRSWLAAVEAEAHAHLNDADTCIKALETSKAISTQLHSGEDPYAIGFNPSRLAGYEGTCFVRLYQHDRALCALQKALELLEPGAIRRRSTLLADIGIVHIQQGNIKEACTCAVEALTITAQTMSLSVLQRISALRTRLEPWKETAIVKTLDEQMTTTLATINTIKGIS